MIAVARSNLGAILHWEGAPCIGRRMLHARTAGSARRQAPAHRQDDCFKCAQQDHELGGYGHAWLAAASLAAGAPRVRARELLAEAGRRLEPADAMRIFNEDAVLSADALSPRPGPAIVSVEVSGPLSEFHPIRAAPRDRRSFQSKSPVNAGASLLVRASRRHWARIGMPARMSSSGTCPNASRR